MAPTLHLRNAWGEKAATPNQSLAHSQLYGYVELQCLLLEGYDMSAQEEKRVFIEGYLDVPAEAFDAAQPVWHEHVDLSLKEPGCQKFAFRFDDDIVGRIWISEIYDNADAFEAHKARTGNSDWGRVGKDFLRNIDVLTKTARLKSAVKQT